MLHLVFLDNIFVDIDCDDCVAARLSGYFGSWQGALSESAPRCAIHYIPSTHEISVRRDRRFPYSQTEIFEEHGVTKIRHYRYGHPIRTIWKAGLFEYFVESYLSGDEEAALICFRQFLYDFGFFDCCPMWHASFVELCGVGILLCGQVASGKTATLVRLTEDHGAVFINDDYVSIRWDVKGPIGFYVPRRVTPRFESILSSKLREVLNNPERTDASQYLDTEAIEEMVSTGIFRKEYGLCFSRASFCSLIRCESAPSSQVDCIIHLEGIGSQGVAREIKTEDSLRILESSAFSRRYFGAQVEFDRCFRSVSSETTTELVLRAFKCTSDQIADVIDMLRPSVPPSSKY